MTSSYNVDRGVGEVGDAASQSVSAPGLAKARDERNAPALSSPSLSSPALSSKVSPAADIDALLGRLIASELIPRLMLVHGAEDRPKGGDVVSAQAQRVFTRMVLHEEMPALCEFVDGLNESGVSRAVLLTDLLGHAAKALGDLWEQDECTFIDVTIGLGRLQQVFHYLRDVASDLEPSTSASRALFALAPGEQHTFGVVVAEDLFRRAGWATVYNPDFSPSDLGRLVKTDAFDVFALSLSCERHVDAAKRLITAVRRSSKNRRIKVIIGGPLLATRKDLLVSLEPDMVASDAKDVERLADILLERNAVVN